MSTINNLSKYLMLIYFTTGNINIEPTKLTDNYEIPELPYKILPNPHKKYKKLINEASENLNNNLLKIVLQFFTLYYQNDYYRSITYEYNTYIPNYEELKLEKEFLYQQQQKIKNDLNILQKKENEYKELSSQLTQEKEKILKESNLDYYQSLEKVNNELQ